MGDLVSVVLEDALDDGEGCSGAFDADLGMSRLEISSPSSANKAISCPT